MQKKSKYLNDDPSDIGWQKYYRIFYAVDSEANPQRQGYIIVYNDDNEDAGHLAHDVFYRTQKLAERGARRLHWRLHGAMEDAIFGPKK